MKEHWAKQEEQRKQIQKMLLELIKERRAVYWLSFKDLCKVTGTLPSIRMWHCPPPCGRPQQYSRELRPRLGYYSDGVRLNMQGFGTMNFFPAKCLLFDVLVTGSTEVTVCTKVCMMLPSEFHSDQNPLVPFVCILVTCSSPSL